MRILHTSDWHIGRRFKGVDLADYQRCALAWLVDVVRREHVDVVCVSGDVYDSPMPSADAVDMLDDALTQLTSITDDDGRPAVDVIVTPGNHDSARKLGFGARMMRSNLHLRCAIEDLANPVMVTRRRRSGMETVAVYPVPYLDPDIARPVLRTMLASVQESNEGKPGDSADGKNAGGEPPAIARSHEGVMTAAMSLIREDLHARRTEQPELAAVLMAHAFVSGAAPSDSERNIAVGDVDSVPAAVFADSGLDYLALGHLHRAQQVRIPHTADDTALDGDVEDSDSGVGAAAESDIPLHTPIARYAGSLLAYSFSEGRTPPVEGNGKSVALLDTTTMAVRLLPVESGQPALVCLTGTPDELLGKMAERHRDDWASITVVCDAYPHDMYRKLDAAYDHPLEKKFEIRRRPRSDGRAMADLRQTHSELDILDGFVRYTLGREPSEEERAVLRQAVEHTRKERA